MSLVSAARRYVSNAGCASMSASLSESCSRGENGETLSDRHRTADGCLTARVGDLWRIAEPLSAGPFFAGLPFTRRRKPLGLLWAPEVPARPTAHRVHVDSDFRRAMLQDSPKFMTDRGGTQVARVVRPPTIQRDGPAAWFKWRLFGPGRWPFTILELGGFVVAAVGTADSWITAEGWMSTPPVNAFRHYLWASFYTLVGLIALTMVVFKKVHTDLREAQVQREDADERTEQTKAAGLAVLALRDEAIVLQHKMAEEVRKCARDPKVYKYQADLQMMLGELLRNFLRRRLGDGKYAVTIKVFEPGSTPPGRLKCIFRDMGQQVEVRNCGDDLLPQESHVYASFTAQTSSPARFVLVRDVAQLAANDHVFKERAAKSGFRSIVAFPLRRPVAGMQEEGLHTAQLLGFLSIDTPEPNRFDGLFVAPTDGNERRNDGVGVQAFPDVDVFYGLADSIATIVMLCRAASS